MPGLSVVVATANSNTDVWRRTPLPNPSCKGSNWTDLTVWPALYKPTFDARVQSASPTRSPTPFAPSAAWLEANASDKLYGTFYSSDAPVSPQTVKYARTFKGNGTYKEWKDASASGRILLRPMAAEKITLTQYPSIPRLSASKAGTFWVIHKGQLNGYPPVIETGCQFFPKGISLNGYAYCQGLQASPSGAVGSRCQQQWYTSGVMILPFSSDRLVEMGSLISWYLSNKDRDEGLITRTLCEAREGAVDITTAAAELPETLRSVYSAIAFIANAYLEVVKKTKRLNNSRDPAITDSVADLWLQFRYNIMPQVYLIEDSLEYLQKRIRVYQTVRGGERQTFDDFNVDGWTLSPVESVDRCFVKNRFGSEFLSPHLGKNLAVTAWELVTRSFILDWILNVGDICAAIIPTTGSDQEAVQYSRRTKTRATLSHPDFIGPPVMVDIDCYTAAPIENIYEEIGLKIAPDMNLNRWLDLSALSWGPFKRAFQTSLRSIR